MTETVAEVEDELTLHRAGQYLDLGFDTDGSFELAGAKDAQGFPVYWGLAKKMLEHGATHAQVIAILV